MTTRHRLGPLAWTLVGLLALLACKKQSPAADTTQPPPAPPADVVAPAPAPDAASVPDAPPPADVPPPPPPLAAGPTGIGAASGFERHYRYDAPDHEARGPVPALPVSLEGVAIPSAASNWLSVGDGRERLAANGFVVSPAERFGKFDQIPDVYEWLEGVMPVFVTVDTALHLYHLAFDALLMTIEEQHLLGMLEQLIDGVRGKALAEAGGSGPVAEAALGVLAVCDTLRVLLNEAAEPDARVAAAVAAERGLIEQHAGLADSPIFGYQEDYSQYIPRGHYTRTPALTRYFKAMMWIGRMSYLLKATGDPAPEGPIAVEQARRLASMAALLTRWLGEAQAGGRPAVQLWETIYRVTAFFAGFSDDLTPLEARPVVDELLGAAEGLAALADPSRVDLLRARLAALRSPRIYSGTAAEAVVVPPERAGDPQAYLENVAGTVGVRLMGQRYTPDADAMGRLIFPTVGLRSLPLDGDGPFTLVPSRAGPTRGFSRGLDVMALLGAPRARPILDGLGDAAYDGFDEALQAAREVFPGPADPAWHQNLYWAWLDVLRTYVTPPARPTQAFETGEAWADRTMTTALASWAQLRHDTILYVKQAYAAFGGAAPVPPPPPEGFVEPQPEVFAKLVALNGMLSAGLQELGVLPAEASATLESFNDLLGRLRDLAGKEVEDRALDAEDNAFLASFGERCRYLIDGIAALNVPVGTDPNLPEWERGQSAVDTRTTLVADVLTNVETGQVLEQATGRVELLTVVMRVPGGTDLVLAAGPVLSYYEFRWPMADRLTDEKWRELLDGPQAPPAPPWTCSYRVPCPAEAAPTP
jgi:hypothetical protein